MLWFNASSVDKLRTLIKSSLFYVYEECWERIPELTASQNLAANYGQHRSLAWAMQATNTISLQSNALAQHYLLKIKLEMRQRILEKLEIMEGYQSVSINW
jgi:uncharacterized membrane protein